MSPTNALNVSQFPPTNFPFDSSSSTSALPSIIEVECGEVGVHSGDSLITTEVVRETLIINPNVDSKVVDEKKKKLKFYWTTQMIEDLFLCVEITTGPDFWTKVANTMCLRNNNCRVNGFDCSSKYILLQNRQLKINTPTWTLMEIAIFDSMCIKQIPLSVIAVTLCRSKEDCQRQLLSVPNITPAYGTCAGEWTDELDSLLITHYDGKNEWSKITWMAVAAQLNSARVTWKQCKSRFCAQRTFALNKRNWTDVEDITLLKLVSANQSWKNIGNTLQKNFIHCQYRWLCYLTTKFMVDRTKGRDVNVQWTSEMDLLLGNSVVLFESNWTAVSQIICDGVTANACRERYLSFQNELDIILYVTYWSEIDFSKWTDKMDKTLADSFNTGCRQWNIIASAIGHDVTAYNCQRRMLYNLKNMLKEQWSDAQTTELQELMMSADDSVTWKKIGQAMEINPIILRFRWLYLQLTKVESHDSSVTILTEVCDVSDESGNDIVDCSESITVPPHPTTNDEISSEVPQETEPRDWFFNADDDPQMDDNSPLDESIESDDDDSIAIDINSDVDNDKAGDYEEVSGWNDEQNALLSRCKKVGSKLNWKDISLIIGRTAIECEKQWNNLNPPKKRKRVTRNLTRNDGVANTWSEKEDILLSQYCSTSQYSFKVIATKLNKTVSECESRAVQLSRAVQQNYIPTARKITRNPDDNISHSYGLRGLPKPQDDANDDDNNGRYENNDAGNDSDMDSCDDNTAEWTSDQCEQLLDCKKEQLSWRQISKRLQKSELKCIQQWELLCPDVLQLRQLKSDSVDWDESEVSTLLTRKKAGSSIDFISKCLDRTYDDCQNKLLEYSRDGKLLFCRSRNAKLKWNSTMTSQLLSLRAQNVGWCQVSKTLNRTLLNCLDQWEELHTNFNEETIHRSNGVAWSDIEIDELMFLRKTMQYSLTTVGRCLGRTVDDCTTQYDISMNYSDSESESDSIELPSVVPSVVPSETLSREYEISEQSGDESSDLESLDDCDIDDNFVDDFSEIEEFPTGEAWYTSNESNSSDSSGAIIDENGWRSAENKMLLRLRKDKITWQTIAKRVGKTENDCLLQWDVLNPDAFKLRRQRSICIKWTVDEKDILMRRRKNSFSFETIGKLLERTAADCEEQWYLLNPIKHTSAIAAGSSVSKTDTVSSGANNNVLLLSTAKPISFQPTGTIIEHQLLPNCHVFVPTQSSVTTQNTANHASLHNATTVSSTTKANSMVEISNSIDTTTHVRKPLRTVVNTSEPSRKPSHNACRNAPNIRPKRKREVSLDADPQWTLEEDNSLRRQVTVYNSTWSLIARRLNKCIEDCQVRWLMLSTDVEE